MSHAKNMALGFISVAPSVVLILMLFFEPMLYQVGWKYALVSEVGASIRLVCGILVVVVMFCFSIYAYRSSDAKLQGKRALWITILVVGNVFAVPVFWYLFLGERKTP